MDVQQLIAQARDMMTVQRVFGDPLEKDGVTIIPAATVQGGGGGGGGEGPSGEGKGGGGGGGISARPAGAYVIENGAVRWQPAVMEEQLLEQQTEGVSMPEEMLPV
jgi:uncharacterized spore protein YtfJ